MKDLSFLLEKPIAHRGYHSQKINTPENSLLSFEEALKRNLPIEIDVRLTKDNHVVVFHDDNLKRMTGVDQLVKDTTLKNLKKLYLNNTLQQIPTLLEVFELINGNVGLLIEIKNFENHFTLEKKLLEMIQQYDGKCAIQSFNPLSVKYFKENGNSVIRGQISTNFKGIKMSLKKKLSYKYLLHKRKTKPDFIAYEFNKMPLLVKMFNRKTKLAWTVKTKDNHIKYSKKFCNVICELYDVESVY